MELLKQILNYGSAIIAILVFIFTSICFIINKVKKKHRSVKAEEKAVELADELEDEKDVFKLVNEIIPLAIKKAEEMPFLYIDI